MQSFEAGFIEGQPITQRLLQTMCLIGEYKGKQELFREQAPQSLETLREASIIQSTESSNCIEGITAPVQRIKELVAEKEKTRPRVKRSYRVSESLRTRNRWRTRCVKYNSRQLCPYPLYTWSGVQLHRDLYQFSVGEGDALQSVDKEISETHPDGTRDV